VNSILPPDASKRALLYNGRPISAIAE